MITLHNTDNIEKNRFSELQTNKRKCVTTHKHGLIFALIINIILYNVKWVRVQYIPKVGVDNIIHS